MKNAAILSDLANSLVIGTSWRGDPAAVIYGGITFTVRRLGGFYIAAGRGREVYRETAIGAARYMVRRAK